jgi:IS5 family transposase
MLIANQAQKPLPLGGLTGDGLHIWNAELAIIDELLCDEQFVDILRRAFKRAHPKTRRNKGARRMALNRTLRSMALKHLKNWSFRQLFDELQRNLDYRAFTQFFDDKIRSVAALSRNCSFIDGKALREMNERVCELAREHKVIKGNMFRQDTTVSEANIHHPTDSTLMQDGIRVLQRIVGKAEQLLPALDTIRDRSRAALHRVLEINRKARSKRPESNEQMNDAYRSLMRITRAAVTHAGRVADKLGDGRVTRHLDELEQRAAQTLTQELDTMLPRVEQVLRQTRARINRGITDSPGKLLSLFEPQTAVIRKGKAHKPAEFGRIIEIVEVENGFVSDYQVHDGNPYDTSMLLPSLERHIERFGKPPRKVAADRGFFSADNEKKAYALGVKRVAIPARGRLSAYRGKLQRMRWFRQLQRWRAGGEGRIGTLKNRYGLDRCMYKGDGAMERWVGWCVFANNLTVLARRTAHKSAHRDHATAHQAKRRGHRKAA